MKKNTKAPIKNGVAKAPVIMQMEMLECGAASLAMVLGYFGKWVPLEQVRVDCGVSRDGSSARNIVMAAQNYGLSVQAYSMEPEQLFENATYPCIIHWEFNHFVVLCGKKGKKIYVNDPARGNVVMSQEEFDRGFTGIVLFFEPTEGFEAGGSRKSILGYAMTRLKGAKGGMVFLSLCLIASALIGILQPGLMRIFVDRLLAGEDSGAFAGLFFGGIILLGIAGIIVTVLRLLVSYRLSGKMAAGSSVAFMRHIMKLPMEFFSQRMAGDIQLRASTNASIVDSFINLLVPLFINFCLMILYLVVMLRYSVLLTLVGLGCMLINLILGRLISLKRVNITRVSMRDEGKLSGQTLSNIYMIESIKSSGAEEGCFEKWAGYQAGVNAQDVKYVRLNGILGALPGLVTSVSSVAVLMLGSYLIMKGEFSVGILMAFQTLLAGFIAPTQSLIEAGQGIAEMRSDMERVEDIMNYKEARSQAEDIKDSASHKLSGNVEIKNLTFGYNKLAKPLISDFSMKLESGKKIALVGGSGSGKSTIAKLVSGLMEPWSGEILFDGRTMNEIDKARFNGSVAVVDQDITLFEDTISSNIKMWDDSIQDFEVIMAARDAAIHKDISEKPGGYSYRLSEDGRNLSGGQRQRLEIARALAADPTILILDEATSALDARTENEVMKAIGDRGITCIVVAHRLSTIRDCDEIIVLDGGQVVERGRHEELYKAQGRYYELVTCE